MYAKHEKQHNPYVSTVVAPGCTLLPVVDAVAPVVVSAGPLFTLPGRTLPLPFARTLPPTMAGSRVLGASPPRLPEPPNPGLMFEAGRG